MYESEVYRQELTALQALIGEMYKSLNIDNLKEQLTEYREEMSAVGFWDDVDRASKVTRKAGNCENRINHYNQLKSRIDDVEVMIELSEEDDGESMAKEIGEEIKKLKEELDALKLTTLMTGEYDSCDCILSLHAGAGGTEAQDWTQMLYRMYVRFGERMGFQVRELDMLDGDDAGVKSVTWEVTGECAYGFMKSERGVHRLVRISPFDAAARRHTSFASLDVAPVIEGEGDIPIENEDLRIDTYRASGKGGQHVNRTDSAVRITHLPTGIVVQCQNERSQLQNKETCFRMLRARLAELQEQKRQEIMGEVKGELKKIEWGSQIRSYVFQPYTMVKDHRTGFESGNIGNVMDGDLEGFVTAYLQML